MENVELVQYPKTVRNVMRMTHPHVLYVKKVIIFSVILAYLAQTIVKNATQTELVKNVKKVICFHQQTFIHPNALNAHLIAKNVFNQ